MWSKPVIWVEGIIGSGKTTLTRHLSESMGMRALYEPVDSNPYLKEFYMNPRRWAFPMQIHLLHVRYNMHQLAAREAVHGGTNGVILDRGMPGDRVFCELHVNAGNISKREWDTYEMAYNVMACSLMPPSILIFLDAEVETAYERTMNRSREEEENVTRDYLRALRDGYIKMVKEMERGHHPWSRGVEVLWLPWNSVEPPVESLKRGLERRYGSEPRHADD